MTSRERFRAALRRQTPDRIPLTDGFPWPETLVRWRKEGLPEKASLHQLLDLDPISGLSLYGDLGFERRLVEEADDYKVEVNPNGVTVKSWKNSYAPPQEMDFAIKTFADWKKYRDRLDPARFPIKPEMIAQSQEARAAGAFHHVSPDEPAWYALRLLGHENCLALMLLEPEFIEDIAERITEFGLAQCEKALAAGCRFDALWFWSDLCYKNGMLYAPALHRRMFLKHHRRYAEWARRHDLPVLYHCDGLVREFIPLLIEAGIDCIQPLEARCGNDVRIYKREFGRDIAFFGNISMDIVSQETVGGTV